MKRSAIISFAPPLGALALLVTVAPQAKAACERCDTKVELNEAQWSCLRQRVPKLSKTTTPLVFMSLPLEGCREAQVDPVRSSDTRLPKISKDAPKVLKLSRENFDCLARQAETLKPVDGKYVFEFAAQCAAESPP